MERIGRRQQAPLVRFLHGHGLPATRRPPI